MKRVLKAILCFICVFCIILTDTGVCYADTDDSAGTKDGLTSSDIKSWNKVKINQMSIGRSAGCTVVTTELILQNSTRLKDEYQVNGTITNRSDLSKFEEKFPVADADWNLRTLESRYNADGLCKGKNEWTVFKSLPKDVTDENAKQQDYDGMAMCVVGMGGKDFLKMSKAEITASMKTLWNSGYFVIFCVRYKGDDDTSGNGRGNYTARHATMMAGVTDAGEVYINDPADGTVKKYSSAKHKSNPYLLTYCLLVKNSEVSPMSLVGKLSNTTTGKSAVTSEDVKSGEKLGLTVSALNGAWSEEQLSSVCKLEEVDVSSILPRDKNQLSGGNLESLDNWETNIEAYGWKARFTDIVRTIVMVVGIIFSVWVILIYVCFWFDRLNNFIDFPLLPFITLGKLEASPTDDESTFRMKDTMKKTGKKTINHRQVVWLCVVALVFGMLIISGEIFAILGKLIVTVHRILKGLS